MNVYMFPSELNQFISIKLLWTFGFPTFLKVVHLSKAKYKQSDVFARTKFSEKDKFVRKNIERRNIQKWGYIFVIENINLRDLFARNNNKDSHRELLSPGDMSKRKIHSQ